MSVEKWIIFCLLMIPVVLYAIRWYRIDIKFLHTFLYEKNPNLRFPTPYRKTTQITILILSVIVVVWAELGGKFFPRMDRVWLIGCLIFFGILLLVSGIAFLYQHRLDMGSLKKAEEELRKKQTSPTKSIVPVQKPVRVSSANSPSDFRRPYIGVVSIIISIGPFIFSILLMDEKFRWNYGEGLTGAIFLPIWALVSLVGVSAAFLGLYFDKTKRWPSVLGLLLSIAGMVIVGVIRAG